MNHLSSIVEGIKWIPSNNGWVISNETYLGVTTERLTRGMEWIPGKDGAGLVIKTAPVPAPLSTKELLLKISDLINQHIFFRDKQFPLLIATWVLGTYLYDEVFTYYGYLWINSPVKRCGKSLLEDILSLLCFSASPRLSNATESSIFRLANSGGTLIFDELETLRSQDKEKYGAIMGVLNNGFQAGGKVPRVERGKDGFQIIYFNAFCPKVLAGINHLVDTIADRSFKIPMVRKTSKEKVSRFNLRIQKTQFEKLRYEILEWAKAKRPHIQLLYNKIDTLDLKKIVDLGSFDDRFLDISEPLLTIAYFSDLESKENIMLPCLYNILLQMSGKRSQVEKDEAIGSFVGLADELLQAEDKVFLPSKILLDKVKGTDDLAWIENTRSLAGFLGKFELIPERHWLNNGTKQARGYLITKAWLEEVKSRYVPSL